MIFQVGDLIITKDQRNRRVPAYVVELHEPGEDKDGIHHWTCPSVTIQYSQGFDHWVRLPIDRVETLLNLPSKLERWYHFPVKS